jgi:hypothetical protein
MSVAATPTTLYSFREERRRLFRRIRVDITGLQTGANTVAHGITKRENPGQGAVPIEERILLTSNVAAHRTQSADATNLYITVDSGSGTTITVYVTV